MMRVHVLLIFIGSLIVISGIIFVSLYIIRDRSLDTCLHVAKRDTPRDGSTKVKIGIIGDSWVTDQKLDQAVLAAMSASGIRAEVVSSGQPGAVTRQVYRNLFSRVATPYSSNHILMDKDIGYLVVVAGINDAVEHIGRIFYAHHMSCIIKAIQNRGIHPVILEVPEFGIEITSPKSFLNYAKRLIYRIVFDGNDHDIIIAYRDALRTGLTPEIKKYLSIIPFSPLVESYSDSIELFENPNHLNKEGYRRLGQMISETIIEVHNNRLKRIGSTLKAGV